LCSKAAAKEIKAFSPNARIIVMLRNPVDMLYSLYLRNLQNGDENMLTFEQALDAEAERKQGKLLPVTAFQPAEAFSYLEIAKFAEQLRRYFDTFGRERVKVIVYDDFAKDTPLVYRDTLSFLGVDLDFKPEFKVINPNQTVRSELLRDLIRRRPAWLRTALKTLLPPLVPRLIMEKVWNWNAKHDSRPPIELETCKRLQELLSPEVERLSELLDRDLTHWTGDERLSVPNG
ncbi:MAG: sulfotransferase domain-containing protein, partial [Nitrososphaera sp.]|nr:sulfotransferase domain-containing protein [Nitrososphaera sp.]